MTIKHFSDYMKEQMEAILQYRHYLSKHEKREVSLEDATCHWVQTGEAERYAKEYWKKHRITTEENDIKQLQSYGPRCLDLGIEMKLIGCTEHHKEVTIDRLDIKYCIQPHGCEYAKQAETNNGIYYCTKSENGNGEKK